jgi:YfiH family protein
MIPMTEDKRMLTYELLNSYANISCFVTTRRGGDSEGAYRSFNCSHYCGDTLEHVLHNRKRLVEGLPCRPLELVVPAQVHGTEVLQIRKEHWLLPPEEKSARLQGVDALITDAAGYCLCISTADCVPIILYDKTHRAIAAVHAGWRGTVAFILRHTLEAMNAAFGTIGSDLLACIGPSISLAAFEVGEEVYDAFRLAGFNMARISCFNAASGKHHLDLWEANRLQLLEYGVPASQIEVAGICTYTHHEEFFSARRLGIHSGRILSGILIHQP